ncbi:MAG: DUF1737 domain-containing protein [Planctomycetaceae bacterium]
MTRQSTFCVRVSEALADGYVLYGSPSCTYDPEQGRVIVAQAVISQRILAP